MENLNYELEKRKTLLNDTCRMTHYNQEGVKQLLYQMESAKKLLIGINERYPECRKNQNLSVSIKKLDYAIKTTLKKVQDIREHIDADGGSQETLRGGASTPRTHGTAETPRKRKFSDILPPERKLQFIDPTFDHLESHSVGTPTTTKTNSKTPRMESTGQAGPRTN